jgi:hypothetical protein
MSDIFTSSIVELTPEMVDQISGGRTIHFGPGDFVKVGGNGATIIKVIDIHPSPDVVVTPNGNVNFPGP